MVAYDSIVKKYEEYNEEEINALKFAEQHNNTPYFNDLAQVIDGKTLIREGMILIRKHPRFCYVSKHSHNYLEINYILKGQVTQILDGTEITLKKGEMLFISTNSKHEFFPANQGDILLNFIILPEFFDYVFPFIDQKGNLKKFLLNLLSNKDENNSIIFHLSDSEQIQNIIENILITYEEKDERMNDLLRSYFLILVYELLKNTDKAEETKSSNYDSIILFKTYNYIENNYTTGSLDELADSLNESYSYLSKRIKKLTGFSFQHLLETERIKASKVLLDSTDANITDIAYHVGYNNLTFFYKLFKKHTGMTPREYKNQKLSNIEN